MKLAPVGKEVGKMKGYSLVIYVPDRLWITSRGIEKPTTRKYVRNKLRDLGRKAWKSAKNEGARPVNKFVLLVSIRNKQFKSAVWADETVKPLIDEGTEEGMWPDDGPEYRVLTVYTQDPRPDIRSSLALTVLPIPDGFQAPYGIRKGGVASGLFIKACGEKPGIVRSLEIPDSMWLNSNDKDLEPGEITKRYWNIREKSKHLWDTPMGPDASVLCSVCYYATSEGDPDNDAQSAIAMYEQGVADGTLPKNPLAFGFCEGSYSDTKYVEHVHTLKMMVVSGGKSGGDLINAYLHLLKMD